MKQGQRSGDKSGASNVEDNPSLQFPQFQTQGNSNIAILEQNSAEPLVLVYTEPDVPGGETIIHVYKIQREILEQANNIIDLTQADSTMHTSIDINLSRAQSEGDAEANMVQNPISDSEVIKSPSSNRKCNRLETQGSTDTVSQNDNVPVENTFNTNVLAPPVENSVTQTQPEVHIIDEDDDNT